MRLRAAVFFLGLVLIASVRPVSAEEAAPKTGWMSHVTGVFHRSGTDAGSPTTKQTKNLVLDLALSPLPLKLSETRQIAVVISVTNKSGHAVQLQFPTTQRFDIVLRNHDGKALAQWSEDQSFDPEFAAITINPREHIEYNATLATRDLLPGGEYVVECFFPRVPGLKVRKTIVPQK